MSKLDDLTAELCPDGVEYRSLGEIAIDMYRGAGIKRDQVTETGTPCVRYGEIYTTYNIWFDTCVSHTDPNNIQSKKYFEHGDILFAITGESVDEIAKSCVYIGHEKCLAGGDIVVMKHNENPKYLAYALSTIEAQRQKSKGKVKSKVVHSSVPALQAIQIPLPPLSVQKEIVRILDKFTALEAELEAELEARMKQYEHYRDNLLTFSDKVERKTLGSVCHLSAGGDVPKDRMSPEKTDVYSIPIYSNGVGDKALYGWTNIPKIVMPCVTVAARGTIGYCALRETPFFPVVRLVCAIPNDSLNVRFLKYYLETVQFQVPTSGIPQLTVPMFAKYIIPVPPLSEQERIVAILDRFDALINDITQGLPAEIAARRKQYEYYRDKLLTFKEKVS